VPHTSACYHGRYPTSSASPGARLENCYWIEWRHGFPSRCFYSGFGCDWGQSSSASGAAHAPSLELFAFAVSVSVSVSVEMMTALAEEVVEEAVSAFVLHVAQMTVLRALVEEVVSAFVLYVAQMILLRALAVEVVLVCAALTVSMLSTTAFVLAVAPRVA